MVKKNNLKIKPKLKGLTLCTMLSVLSISPCTAADLKLAPAFQQPDEHSSFFQGEFTATLGARGYFEPAFPGAKSVQPFLLPTFALNRKGAPESFGSPHDSAGFALMDSGFLRFGPVLGFQLAQYPSDDKALKGLRKVNLALEPGVFAEILPTDHTRIRVEFREGVTGHYGQIVDFSGDIYGKVSEKLLVAAGPRLTLSSSTALKPYFDVNEARSVTSGLPVYKNKGGVRSVGFGSVLRYSWTKQIETELYGEYERLVGTVAKAPLVKQRGSTNQFVAGLGLSYKFDFTSPFGK